MWLLVVLCVSVSCSTDLIGLHRADTEKACREQLEATYTEYGITGMCIHDKSMIDPLWEEFE